MPQFNPVARADVCVTAGEVTTGASETEFVVRHPETRGQLRSDTSAAARGEFRFLGVTEKTVPAASGKIYTQFGLKLRAMDTCNVVYVTWRLEPVEQVLVLLKRNPGQSKHCECGNNGYCTVASHPPGPTTFASAKDGEIHILEARIDEVASGFQVRVQIDNYVAPQVLISRDLLAEIVGPIGFRTDNGKFDFQLFKST